MTRKLDEFVRSNEAGVKDLVRVKSSLTYEMLQTSVRRSLCASYSVHEAFILTLFSLPSPLVQIHEIMASVFNFQQRIQLPWMASLSEDNGAIFIVSRLPSFAGLRNLRVREELVDPGQYRDGRTRVESSHLTWLPLRLSQSTRSTTPASPTSSTDSNHLRPTT